MDGWVRVLRPFNSISVFSRRWKGEHERLCAMKRRLGSGRISPPAGFEPATPWSEVGSANRSATRTLPYDYRIARFVKNLADVSPVSNFTYDLYVWYLHICLLGLAVINRAVDGAITYDCRRWSYDWKYSPRDWFWSYDSSRPIRLVVRFYEMACDISSRLL